MAYIDGYVPPIRKDKLDEYRAIAEKAGKVWMEHGALAYTECVAEDTQCEFAKDSFPRAVNLQEGETVIFAYVVFHSRAHRDEVNTKAMNDARLKEGCENPPFDCSRMVYAGFTPIVQL